MANEGLFSGKADYYDKYRVGFPDALLDWLYDEQGFGAAGLIADIGAGTGIFTGLLLERGSRVIAVEPNADMRAVMVGKRENDDRLTILDATAEATGIAGHSVDFITVARAFHWFDPVKFKAECRRILKTGGKVAILGNGDLANGDLGKEVQAIKDAFAKDAFVSRTDVARSFERSDRSGHIHAFKTFFKDGVYNDKTFRSERTRTKEQFIGDVMSRSYAPEVGGCGYDRFVGEFGRLFDKYAMNGLIVNGNEANCSIGEV